MKIIDIKERNQRIKEKNERRKGIEKLLDRFNNTDVGKCLEDYLKDFQLKSEILSEPLNFSHQPYHFQRLINHSRIDVLVCGWSSGQSSEIHHYDGSCGAIKIITGKLRQEVFQLDSNSKVIYPKRTQNLICGSITPIQRDEAHQLIALEKTVSIHIYNRSSLSQIKSSSVLNMAEIA